MGKLWVVLVLIAGAVAGPAGEARAVGAGEQPELLLSPWGIDSVYGPVAMAVTFYEGEGVEVKLTLANRTEVPLQIGDSLAQEAWVPAVKLTLARVTEKGAEAVPAARWQRTHYQAVLKEAGDRPAGVLRPGEYIETLWTIGMVDGKPLPAGDYLIQADARGRWPSGLSGLRQLSVTAATDRISQLNRLHHIAVRQRWAKRFDESLATLNQLLALCPGSPAAYAEMGSVHRDAGRYDEAIALYEKAIAIVASGQIPQDEGLGRVAPNHWVGGLKLLVSTCQRMQAASK